VFGNLETDARCAAARETRRAILQLRGEPRFAEDLKRAGFTVLNVADNHAFSMETTHSERRWTQSPRRALRVVACAKWRMGQPAVVMEIHGANGRRPRLCQRPRQYGGAVPPYAEGTADEICSEVRRLRASGATPSSWYSPLGENSSHIRRLTRSRFGRSIIDAGASLIIGHHPHVTRPAERYKSGVIAYSLGTSWGHDLVRALSEGRCPGLHDRGARA